MILLLAAALRIYRVSAASFGVDELFSTYFAMTTGPWETQLPAGTVLDPAPRLAVLAGAKSVWNVKATLARDSHPPLHALLLRGWMRVFGESDAAERSLSIVFSLLAIVLLFDAVKTLHGAAAGLWAAAIMALAGPQIQFAQEVRSYMMLVMFSCAAAAVAARIAVLGPSYLRITLLAFVALAAMLTHYWAIAPLLGVMIYLLPMKGRRLALLGALAAAAIAFLVLWGDVLWQQRPYLDQNMRWIADDSPGHVARTFRSAAIAPLRLLFNPGDKLIDDTIDGLTWLWLPISIAYLLPLMAIRRNRCLMLWWLLMVLPVALVVVADLTQHRKTIYFLRFVLPASVGLYALVAGALAVERSWRRHVIPAVALLACAFALPRAWDPSKSDFRLLATAVAKDLGSCQMLVLIREKQTPWSAAIVYMALSHYAGPISVPVLVLEEHATTQQLAVLGSKDRVLILSPLLQPPVGQVVDSFEVIRQGGVPGAGGWAVVRVRAPSP